MAKETKQLPPKVHEAVTLVKQNGVAFLAVPIEDRQWTAGTHAAMLARLAALVFANTGVTVEENRQVFRDLLQNTTTITEQSNFKKRLVELGLMAASDKKSLADD